MPTSSPEKTAHAEPDAQPRELLEREAKKRGKGR